MTTHFGMVRPGRKLRIPFHTFSSDDPSASITLTGLAVTDIEIYKNGSATQRASDSGYSLLDTDGIDFDSITGIHGFEIDLADNSDSGFFVAGAEYWVVVSSVTVDGATINFIAATFSIGYPDAIINTTIATLSSQTSFTLTDGPAEASALVGCPVLIHDVASAVQVGHAVISAYDVTTKTVTLTGATTFTVAAGDNISIFMPSAPTAGQIRQEMDANSTQLADILSVVSGIVSSVGTVTDLGGGATLGANLLDVAGATFDTATDSLEAIRDRGDAAWTTATGFSTHSSADVADAVWDEAISGHLGAGSTGEALANATAPTAAAVADAVWDEALSGHLGAGSTGEALNAAGGAGDPWITSLPGSYTSGQAGYILGTFLTAAPPTAAAIRAEIDSNSTQLAAILVYTAEIGAAGAGLSAIPWNAAWDAEVQSECTDALNAYDPPTQTELTAAFTEIKGATWSSATDTLEALRDRGDAAWITATGFSTHSAADVRTEMDANSTQLAAIVADTNELQGDWTDGGRLDLIVDAILVDTGTTLPATLAALNDISVADILTTAMTESYRSAGSAPTVAQALCELIAGIHDFAIASTTKTIKKIDGTTAKTFTLDDATTPTSITETT